MGEVTLRMVVRRSLRWTGRRIVRLWQAIARVMLWRILCVKRDIVTLERGGRPRYGIPHYGVFLVQNITSLIYFPVFWMQTLWMIHLEMQRELIRQALTDHSGNWARAARALDLDASNLHKLARRLGVKE